MESEGEGAMRWKKEMNAERETLSKRITPLIENSCQHLIL